MSFTLRVLIGLFAGLGTGMVLSTAEGPWARAFPGLVEPIGAIFINAIRMTVIPLVVSSLVVGVASGGDARVIGRTGGRALVLFLVGATVATLFGLALGYPALQRLQIDPALASSLRAAAGESGSETLAALPTFSEWLLSLVPINPIRAAADGTMLPLIVFTLAFGLALTRIEEETRRTVVRVFRGFADAMLVLVGWVLRFAPIGVFALAVPLAARMGISAAGVLAYYIGALSAISAAFIVLVALPVGVIGGRLPLNRFVRACAPALAVAFTSRSSMAALPAAMDGARTGLRLPEEIPSFFLPLSASMFRAGAAIGQIVGVLFIATLYGVTLEPSALATIVFTVVLTTFSVPGVPAGAIIMIAPALLAANLPVEGIGLLIGVDTIPDMFRTAANVAGWMAGGAVIGRNGQRQPVVEAPLGRDSAPAA
jgi:proton glutamate symport protein